jgi:hypothetical protein
MANYNKSFNFRNGVQVDNDNFVVNANGLVGIGTTIPTDFLDVYGTSKFNDSITGTNITLSGLTSTGRLRVGIVSIASGIVTAISGIITYYGDGGKLLNLPTSQWIDVDSGFGYTSIFSRGNVGIATINPIYTFQVGNNPNTSSGVGFNSTGSIKASGIITAYSYSGFGTDLQGINASNITNGTLTNSRLPSDINLTGIITANSFSGFGTNLQGINASNITNGTLTNSRLPSNINVSGIITASTNFSGNITGNVNSTGFSTFSGGISVGNVNSTGFATFFGGISVGNVNSTGLSTFSGGIVGNVSGNVNSTGLSTFSGGIVGNVTGNLTGNVNSTGLSTFSGGIIGNVTGIASTARSLTGTPNIQVGIITSSSINIAKSTGEVVLNIGNSIGVGQSEAQIRFGSQINTLDIRNLATGDINYYIHSGNPGISTGNFNWLYGQNNGILLTLTYDGKLGIGITNPVNAFHVVGIATISSDLNVGGNFVSNGTITAGAGSNRIILGGSSSNIFQNTNLNNISGITTLSQLHVTGVSSIGIGTDKPIASLDARNRTALFGQIGINTTSVSPIPTVGLTVLSDIISSGSVGLGTTNVINLGIDIYNKNITISNNISIYNNHRIGFNTTVVAGAIDMRNASLTASLRSPFYPPILTTSERNAIDENVVTGALIYNSTSSRLELFKGSAWVGIATIA